MSLFCSSDQGARASVEEQDRAASAAEGSEGGARSAAGGQSHRRRSEQALQNQSGEAFDRAGAHRYLAEAEVRSARSLQKQEVFATRSPP